MHFFRLTVGEINRGSTKYYGGEVEHNLAARYNLIIKRPVALPLPPIPVLRQASPCPTLSPSLPQLGLRADASMYCFWYVSCAHLLGSRSYVRSSKIFSLVLFPGRRSKTRRLTSPETEASHFIGLDHRELLSVLPPASDFGLRSYTPRVCVHLLVIIVLPPPFVCHHRLTRFTTVCYTIPFSQDGGPLGLKHFRGSSRNKGLVVPAGFGGREYGPPNVRQDAHQDHIFRATRLPLVRIGHFPTTIFYQFARHLHLFSRGGRNRRCLPYPRFQDHKTWAETTQQPFRV